MTPDEPFHFADHSLTMFVMSSPDGDVLGLLETGHLTTVWSASLVEVLS